jgi:hypothetical protein
VVNRRNPNSYKGSQRRTDAVALSRQSRNQIACKVAFLVAQW